MPSAITNECDQCELEIPLIDLSHQNIGHPQLLETLHTKVRKACEEWGCFQVVNHGIGEDVLQNVDSVARDLFSLPKETKVRHFSPFPAYTYKEPSEILPFYESFGIAGVPRREMILQFSEKMWPQGNQTFCRAIEAYSEQMIELANDILKIILNSFGVSKYYTSHFENCERLLRLNNYHVPERPVESVGLVPHKDTSSVTILCQDDMTGLQVLNGAAQWEDVKPLPNSCVVIVGELLQAWSNKRIRSVKHRVIAKSGWKHSRLSSGLWSFFPEEMEITAPPEFLDTEHPRQYKAFTYSAYRDFRSRERKPLEAFAAISGNE